MAVGGQGLPLLYPQGLTPLPFNLAQQPISRNVALPAGGAILIPPGTWMIFSTGGFSVVQYLSPVSGEWVPLGSSPQTTGFVFVNSDGVNFRVWNPKGFPISGTVTAAGSGYVQSSTTVTSGSGGSLWHAIVGGAVNSTVTIGNDSKGNVGGAGFTLPPILVVQAPPAQIQNLPSTATAQGGVAATATCTISAGAINAVTVVAAGAGYTAAPTIQVIPNPFDPAIGSITVPTLTTTLTGAGTITAVLLDFFGTASGSAPTLTIAGAGTAATATASIVATAATDTVILQQVSSGI
jgi:hypothetical protein